jgi:glycosyltransferase involved in cell wall biosynthesis
MNNKKKLEEKISCILLTYNHAHTIDDTIKSILNQKLKNFEFIISDDCSSDGTWERLINIKKKYPDINLTQTNNNLGMANHINYAFSLTTRPYVALLNHDDLYEPNLLEEWGQLLEKYQTSAFVFNSYKNYDNGNISTYMPSEILNGDWLIRNSLLENLYCKIRATCMIRKSAFNDIGGTNPKYGYIADVDLWIRLAKKYSVCFSNKTIITVKNEKPKNFYPEEYLPYGKFWDKKNLLYELYLDNIDEYRKSFKIKDRILWYKYLLNVNKDIIYWILILIYKKKFSVLSEIKKIIKRKEIYIFTFIFIKILIYILSIKKNFKY